MTLEQAEIQADIAKLDLIEAQARQSFGDDRLTIVDVAAIYKTAETFGVLRRHAYSRLKDLGLLSYQRAAIAQPQPEERGPLPLDPSPQGEGGGVHGASASQTEPSPTAEPKVSAAIAASVSSAGGRP